MSTKSARNRLLVAIGIAAAIWLLPTPAGLTHEAWHVFAVFVGCISSFLLRGFPMGAVVVISLTALSVSRTLSLETCLSGFGNKTVWLVVAAFLLAGAVRRTGLGRRIALMLVSRLGRSTLGLGYAICAAELVLGPVVPSNTARGGGVLAPVVQSLCRALGSTEDGTPQRAGAYLVQVAAHANIITAAMFLTGMAANPLVSQAAADVLGVDFGWGTWALGAMVPGLMSLALLPHWFMRLSPPTLLDATPARELARRELADMGPWGPEEKAMAGVFVGLLLLWSTKALHGYGSTLVAWIGICALLITGTQKWRDFVSESSAWDTLVWLGGLLTMATALKDLGLIDWAVGNVATTVTGLPVVVTVLVLALVYFYSMYGFSMLTGHIAALVGAFFGVCMATGVADAGAALMTAALFAYFSSLCACLTNYSTGPVIIYFGLRYVPATTWLRNGAVIGLLHLAVWLTAGLAWWRLLGWW